jgi:NADH dehydrogenase (ubiquinone) 1 alpha/beta subcomplex 1
MNLVLNIFILFRSKILIFILKCIGFEIPDEDAEKLHKPKDIVQYVCDREDIYD